MPAQGPITALGSVAEIERPHVAVGAFVLMRLGSALRAVALVTLGRAAPGRCRLAGRARDGDLGLASRGAWPIRGASGSCLGCLGRLDLLALRRLAGGGSPLRPGSGDGAFEKVCRVGLRHQAALPPRGVVRVDDALLGGFVERADRGGDGGGAIALDTAEGDARGALHQCASCAPRPLVDGMAALLLADALQSLGGASALPGPGCSCHERSSAMG